MKVNLSVMLAQTLTQFKSLSIICCLSQHKTVHAAIRMIILLVHGPGIEPPPGGIFGDSDFWIALSMCLFNICLSAR